MNTEFDKSVPITAGQLDVLERAAQLAEKYGLAMIFAFLLLAVVLYLVRLLVRGDLVPRSVLLRSESERERLQAILDREREGFISPLIETANARAEGKEASDMAAERHLFP